MTAHEKQKLIKYWLDSGNEDWRTFLSLKRAKRYAHALFFLHLSLEKKIKALIVFQTKAQAPYGHNLNYLLGKTNINASNQMVDTLDKMSEFNMEARYSDQKLQFYKKTTKDDVEKWQLHAKNLHYFFDQQFKSK